MADRLPPGTKVEIRIRFDRSWAKGFEVADRERDGDGDGDGAYRIRRLSDGALLPIAFAADDVRRERTSSMWWI